MQRTLQKAHRHLHRHRQRVQDHFEHHGKKHAIAWFLFGLVVTIGYGVLGHRGDAAGIDTVDVTLVDSEAVNAESRVQIVFTPVTNLSGTVSLYLGETTAGDEWQDSDADQSGIDITCVQAGTTFTNGMFAAATTSTPMLYTIDVNTGGNTNGVTCTLGSSGTDAPNNPATADGYTVAVVTSADSGAGIAYVGDANDVTIQVQVLAQLTLTIDNPDGSTCTGTDVISCDMGVMTTAAVATGNYDVNAGTNATNGLQVSIEADGELDYLGEDIDPIAEDGTVTAGVEGNGIAVAADMGLTEEPPFDDDDTPIPTTADVIVSTTAPVSASGPDTTVTHRVAISTATIAGNYDQVATYTAAANF